MAENEVNNVAEGWEIGRGPRGRYHKFNASMDVVLLEAMHQNNPFSAKHGTRLQMWSNVAETVGMQLFKNPEAYSWHTCRDRATALIRMYEEGKHDKLFKHGSSDENARKELLLSGLGEAKRNIAQSPVAIPTTERKSQTNSRKRKLESQQTAQLSVNCNTTNHIQNASSILGTQSNTQFVTPPQQPTVNVSGTTSLANNLKHSDQSSDAEGDTFRARILHLIENKLQFDMEQRSKENQLREQELELQKRFLEYLQSK